MTLPAPNLDDRSFQDLVDEAKRLVQRQCPEWTDNNVADPGVTLIETFAYMVDQLIYRLNRVPDLNYIKFLELLGEQIQPPASAIAPMRFSLTVPQPNDVLIAAGTLTSTARRGQDRQITFSTERDLVIASVTLSGCATQSVHEEVNSRMETIAQGGEFPCFSAVPQVGDALYIGLSQAAPSNIVRITTDSRIEGIGVDPLRPPLTVEAWDGQDWESVRVLQDTTGGLNRKGYTDVQIGKHVTSNIGGKLAGWIRVRIVPTTGDQPHYTNSPQIRSIQVDSIGGVTNASQSLPIVNEIVGQTSGTPGQSMKLDRTPLVAGQDDLTIEVSTANGWTTWTRVDTFAQSTAQDRHFMADDVSGTIRFGPMVRQPDGQVRYYGAVPEGGATVRVPEYHVGGGRTGNVEAGTISVMRTSIPFVSKVENTEPAVGGVDAETIDSLKARAALTVRTRNRAVTALDFEQLVQTAAPTVVRTRAVDATELGKPGVVLVLVVPQVPDGIIPFEALKPKPEVLDDIKDYLDQRRLIGTTIRIEPPKYLGVSVMVRLAAVHGADHERVTADANAAIASFLHPLTGGYEKQGWPFGRQLVVGDIHGVLQHVPGILYVDVVRIVAVDPVTGAHGEPGDRIQPGPLELVFNEKNQIEVIS